MGRPTTTGEIRRARAMRDAGRHITVIACDLNRAESWVKRHAPPKPRQQVFRERLLAARAAREAGASREAVAERFGWSNGQTVSVALSRLRRLERAAP